jgi:multidrug efflux pump subunit AcrB
MGCKRRIVIIVLYPLFFTSGFFVGLYYGGFMTGLSTTSLVSIFSVFGVSDALGVMVLLKEIFSDRSEEKKERHGAWKLRVLKAYDDFHKFDYGIIWWRHDDSD